MRRSWFGNSLLGLTLVALAVAAVVAAPRTADAKPKSKLLVIQTEGTGVSDAARSAVMSRLRANLERYPNLDLLDTPRASLIDDMFELECFDLDDECLGKLARKYKADKLLLASLEKSPGTGLTVDLKLYDPTAGRVTSAFRRVEVAEAGLAGIAEQGVQSVLGPPPPPEVEKGTVQVTANVAGAQVRVGKVAAGETPFTAEVEPGTYPIVITKPGYEEFVTRATVKPGAVSTVRGELAVIPIEPPVAEEEKQPPVTVEEVADQEEETPLYKTWWFWTGVGAVVAGGVIATALLLAPEDSPSTGDLDFTLRPGEIRQDPVFHPMP